MAEIFLAVERGFQGVERQVAIKRILPHMAEAEDFITMFMDEARVAARLTHPNIAHIYSFGEVEGVYYLAMEYVDGLTSSKMVKAARPGTIPAEITLRILADVCSALNYAHELRDNSGELIGLVHRDVNPQNVMVSRNGVAKLLDFGVARASTQSHATRVGQVKGKIGYIAPEVFRGNPLDHRADIFSAGTLLFELLSGKKLFRREIEAATIHAILHDEPPKLASTCDVPDKVDEIIARALAKEPDERYPSAVEMQQDLEELIAGHGYVASPFVVGRFVRELLEKPVGAERPSGTNPSAVSASASLVSSSVPSGSSNVSVSSSPSMPYQASSNEVDDDPTQTADDLTVVEEGAPSSLSELESSAPPSSPARSASPAAPPPPNIPPPPSIPPPSDARGFAALSSPSTSALPDIPPPPEIPPPASRAPSSDVDHDDTGDSGAPLPRDAPAHEGEASTGDEVISALGAVPSEEWQADDAVTQVMSQAPEGMSLISAAGIDGAASTGEPWDMSEPEELERRSSRGLLYALFGAGLLLLVVASIVFFLFGSDEQQLSAGGSSGGPGAVATTSPGGAESEPGVLQVFDATPAIVDVGGQEAVDAGSSVALPELDASVGGSPRQVTAKAGPDAGDRPAKAPVEDERRLPPGKLYLHTNPWTKVRTAGRNLGTTPIVGASLPAGVHTLYLTDAEGERHARRVRIRPGAATKLSFDFR